MISHAPALTRLAIALALSLPAPLAAARSVPVGFEDLLDGQVEQLEVRLFGRSAGLSPVRVSVEHVQLEDPAGVLSALELSADAQAALLPALSQPLPRNSHLACRYGGSIAGCGYLDAPEEAGAVRAIFDEGEGAVRLFIARQWITEAPSAARFHQLSNNAENALLHQQTINYSGGRGYQALTAQGSGVLGVMQGGHLAVEWNFSSLQYRAGRRRQKLQFDNGYYRHDLGPQHYLQLGRMDRRNLSSPQGGTFSFSMLPLDRFEGVRAGTTQAYVDSEAAVQSSPLTVLLGRDARVDAFDGERLLQTFYLQAGINQLDTRSFPYGSYTVSLRIYEDGMLVRSEQAPFDKGGDWAGGGVQWFAQAGRRNERRSDHFDGQGAAMAGVRAPLGPDAALTAGMARLGGMSFAELRVDLRRSIAAHDLRASISGMQGHEGSTGQQYQLSYRRGATWNLYQQRMRGKACESQAYVRDALGCADSLSASLAVPVAGGNAYVAYTRRRTWSQGVALVDDLEPALGALAPLLPPTEVLYRKEPALSRTWQASYSRVQHWGEFSASPRIGVWQQRNEGAFSAAHDRGIYLSLTLTRLQRDVLRTSQRRYGLDMRQATHQRPDLSYSAGQAWREEQDARFHELALDVRGSNTDRYSASMNAQVHNRIGSSGVAMARFSDRDRSEMSYSATHSSSLALSRHGFYWGNGVGGEAGLAVQVEGTDDLELSGVAAELQVGGLRRHRLALGERRLLSLPAYQSHRAQVQDASDQSSDAAIGVAGIGAGRAVFLTPGKLVTMPVPIEITYTFIGSARDLAGEPINGARILNAPVPSTGSNGGFVADFAHRETTLYLLQGSRLLHCPLEVRERRHVVMLVGTIRCQPLAVAHLPAEIRRQARVSRLLQESALIAAVPSTASAGEQP